jgi:sugar phosphate isomerase/epimerase
MGRRERRGPLGRPGLRWKAIKAGLQEVGYGGMDWIELDQNRGRWGYL